jgi:hypothetical protein
MNPQQQLNFNGIASPVGSGGQQHYQDTNGISEGGNATAPNASPTPNLGPAGTAPAPPVLSWRTKNAPRTHKCAFHMDWSQEEKLRYCCWACLPLVNPNLAPRKKACANPYPWTKSPVVNVTNTLAHPSPAERQFLLPLAGMQGI